MEPEPSTLETNPEGEQFLDDLMSDALPGEGDAADPGANLEGDQGQPVKEPEPAAEKPKDGVAPATVPEAAPKSDEPKTYEYKGKQYTLDQMVELGVLEDALQTARQFPTIQTKYQSLLEEKATPQAPQPGQQAPAPTGPTGDQILQSYAPIVQDMANQGYIEPEVFEVFPKLATALMFHRDLLYDVRNAVAAMMHTENARAEVSQKDAALNYVGGLCDKVSGEGEHFTLLKDGEVRKGFYQYLGSLNVQISKVDEDFIRSQWVAYNSGPMLEAVKLAASGQKAADVRSRRNAKGEGGGVRPTGPKPAANTDQDLITSFLE
jgi:hypothetical protein